MGSEDFTRFTVSLPNELHIWVYEQAERENRSINNWIVTWLSEAKKTQDIAVRGKGGGGVRPDAVK